MKPGLLAVVCIVAAGFLASSIDARSHAEGGAADPLFLALGSAKEAVGDTLFIRADEYFHGGVMEKHHHDKSVEDVHREGILSSKKEEALGRMPADWIDRVNGQVRATQDSHLTKEKRKEMLPFFKWATDLDPHNVEAILTTAYWLEKEFEKPDEARALLEKGVRDNPSSWELESEFAKALLKCGDIASSKIHLRAALTKSLDAKLEDFERRSLVNRIKELSAKV